ncbi:MAG TPA: DUF2242 domain-containing protein, partial [Casimicrobiaceae bacterium]
MTFDSQLHVPSAQPAAGAVAAAVPSLHDAAAQGSIAAAPATPDIAATISMLAALPSLARALPAAGRKTRGEPLPGSADALALAQL